MKDKVILIVMVVSLAFNLGVLAMFGTVIIRGYLHHNQERELGEGFSRRLDLTSEQEKALDDIRDDMHHDMEPLREKMVKKRAEALKLLEEPELDTEKRDKLFAEIADLQMQTELAMFNHMYEIKNELTPEQQEIFLETMEDRICPEGGPMGPGLGRGRGGPGFHKHRMEGGMEQPFHERRNDYEEMDKGFKGGPGGPHGSGGNPDSGKPGGKR